MDWCVSPATGLRRHFTFRWQHPELSGFARPKWSGFICLALRCKDMLPMRTIGLALSAETKNKTISYGNNYELNKFLWKSTISLNQLLRSVVDVIQCPLDQGLRRIFYLGSMALCSPSLNLYFINPNYIMGIDFNDFYVLSIIRNNYDITGVIIFADSNYSNCTKKVNYLFYIC